MWTVFAQNCPVRAARVRQDDRPHTAMDWEVYPAGLTEILLWIKGRYGKGFLKQIPGGPSLRQHTAQLSSDSGGYVRGPARFFSNALGWAGTF